MSFHQGGREGVTAWLVVHFFRLFRSNIYDLFILWFCLLGFFLSIFSFTFFFYCSLNLDRLNSLESYLFFFQIPSLGLTWPDPNRTYLSRLKPFWLKVTLLARVHLFDFFFILHPRKTERHVPQSMVFSRDVRRMISSHPWAATKGGAKTKTAVVVFVFLTPSVTWSDVTYRDVA